MFRSSCISFALLCALTGGTGWLRAQVSFSDASGCYDHPFLLTLRCPEGQSIGYTLDGSEPASPGTDSEVNLFLSPDLYSQRDLFRIPDSPSILWNPPDSVTHIIVVRAAAFNSQGKRQGATVTHTYLVADLIGYRPTLPVISVVLPAEALFDPDSGIFSPNGFNLDDDFFSGNFNQHGREWERTAWVEYLDPDGGGFAQCLGLRVHGGKTRRNMQKPLKLYARRDYGPRTIEYPLFDERPYHAFKRLVLKPFSASWYKGGVQDALAHSIAEPLSFLSLASRPVTLFINGEYWGIYYLQESPDEHLVASLEGADDDEVDLIGSWLGLEQTGNNAGFLQMMYFMEDVDFSDSIQYARAEELIDIDNFIDYQLFEAFICNNDWPANNMRCYQYDDRPWRWIFYDGDACFIDPKQDFNPILTYEGDDTWPSSRESTLCLRRLLQSPLFVDRMARRLNEIIATAFHPDHTRPLLAALATTVAPEVGRQAARFNVPVDSVQWRIGIAAIDRFLAQRPSCYRKQMQRLLAPSAVHGIRFAAAPNPTHGNIVLFYEESLVGWTFYHLYDRMGRVLYEGSIYLPLGQSSVPLSLPPLPTGIYLMRLDASNETLQIVVY